MADKLSEKDIDNISIEGTEEHSIMPLRNTVLFPQQVIPITWELHLLQLFRS